ncbi:MAG: T9SS type A sorting domain-containing protein [Flavobacteriales bacterium]|nr:T9SS type A sorting domain-containing protein [Flavobacteriales bacterium]
MLLILSQFTTCVYAQSSFLCNSDFVDLNNPDLSLSPIDAKFKECIGTFSTLDLTDHGNCLEKVTYQFKKDCGFQAEAAAVSCDSEYTIELYFMFDNAKDWNRIISWGDGDNGLYSCENGKCYDMWDNDGSHESGNFEPGVWINLVATRTSKGLFKLWVNGKLELTYNDKNKVACGDELVFFADVGGGWSKEASSGKIAYLSIENGVISNNNIMDRSECQPCCDCEEDEKEMACSIALNKEPTCQGECDGQASVTVFGNNLKFMVDWGNGEFSSNQMTSPFIHKAVALCNGSYEVTVTDELKNTTTCNILMTEPSGLLISGAATDPSCFKVCDGAIEISVANTYFNSAETSINFPGTGGTIRGNKKDNFFEIKVEGINSTKIDENTITSICVNVTKVPKDKLDKMKISLINPCGGVLELIGEKKTKGKTFSNVCFDAFADVEITMGKEPWSDLYIPEGGALNEVNGPITFGFTQSEKPNSTYSLSEAQTLTATGLIIVNQTLFILGTDGPDQIQVSDDGDYWKVKAVYDDGDNETEEWFSKSEIINIEVAVYGDDDQVQIGSVNIPSIIFGGGGDDQLQGGSGDDNIYGENGDDNIEGKDGDDLLVGGSGNDNIQGGKGNNTIFNDEPDLENTKLTECNPNGVWSLYIHTKEMNDGILGDWNLTFNNEVVQNNEPTFSWEALDNPEFTSNSEDLENLCADMYTVWVSDDSDCSAHQTFVVLEPYAITATSYSTSESMLGAYDGTATVDADGGTGIYSYLWNDDNTENPNLTLTTGEACCTITDENDCSTTTCALVDFITSVSKINQQDYISVRGNQVFINATQGILEIFNINGQVIHHSTLNGSNHAVSLEQGIYIVKFSNYKKLEFKKVNVGF